MLTEDQLADQIGARLRAECSGIQPRPDLLAVLRHRQARRARTVRAAIAGAPAAAAGVAAAVVLATSGPAVAPAGRPAATARVPAAGSLRTAILTAFDGAQDQILYDRQVITVRGGTPQTGTTEFWYSPAQPRFGQRETIRYLSLGRNGAPLGAGESSYVVPRGGAGDVAGEIITVDYQTRTWSDQKNAKFPVKPVGAGGSVAAIRAQIAAGNWSVTGTRTLGGRRTIELTWPGRDGPASKSWLWVDARTYLPVKAVMRYTARSSGTTEHGTVVDQYAYLAPSLSNLTRLRVAIPAGFTRTAVPEVPPSRGGGKG
jgi:hypothetical protein